MITRPLELASRLRPEPRSFDAYFFVNGGLIVLFFFLFDSKFVLAPAVGAEFPLPQVAGALVDARPATHHVTVTNSGQIFVREGVLTLDLLKPWLQKQAKTVKEPVLLVQAEDLVPMVLWTSIVGAAREAGFVVMFAVDEPKTSASRGGP